MVYDMGPRFESDVMFLMSPNMGLTVDSESQPEGAWSVSQPWRRVPYIHYAPKPYSSYSDCMHQFESCTQHAHAQFPYLLPCSNPLRVAAFSRAGSSIAQVFVGSLRLLRAASDMRRRRLVKRGRARQKARKAESTCRSPRRNSS